MTSPAEIAASYRFARSITARSGSTFRIGFGLLPRDQADAMHALYAFCRRTDDIADGDGTDDDKRRRLDDWSRSLDGALSGRMTGEIGPALADTVARFEIDPSHLHDQIAGNRFDIDRMPIETIADLERYMDLVAGSVGMACLAIWKCRDAAAIEPARAAGRALQLTNIIRDLREDHERGRVYLPADEILRFDCSPDRWKADDPRFQSMMAFQVERAKAFFQDSEKLTPMLPAWARRVFRLFQDRYRAILDEIERRKFDVFSSRVRVGKLRTFGIVAKALIS